jgi:hypothetical protein
MSEAIPALGSRAVGAHPRWCCNHYFEQSMLEQPRPSCTVRHQTKERLFGGPPLD